MGLASNKIVEEVLKGCVFIGSKSIKLTETDVMALKDALKDAKRWQALLDLDDIDAAGAINAVFDQVS